MQYNTRDSVMHESRDLLHTAKNIIASSECATLKHVLPSKRVINVLLLVTVTFNHEDVLKLTGTLVHTLIVTNLMP